jgi:Lon protease-like protein
MTEMPMFPLGSVLLPHMPLPLRVFEPRYLEMLAQILEDEPSEFGVVLIERGQEVGGGEKRMMLGTVAQIAQLDAADVGVLILAQGERRIRITEWLDDDPFPRANVEVLPELEWSDDLAELRDDADSTVRRVLARASEWEDQQWSAQVELSADPGESAWQLAGIAPLGPIDQLQLLRAETMQQLLTDLLRLCTEFEETL